VLGLLLVRKCGRTACSYPRTLLSRRSRKQTGYRVTGYRPQVRKENRYPVSAVLSYL